MIYLDTAATSLQKPPEVSRAVISAMARCASPGRGGHQPATAAADLVFRCREVLAEFFHVPSPEQVVLTMNATHGLNIAIRHLVGPGTRVAVSGYEHNAVMRPLHDVGARVEILRAPPFDTAGMLTAFASALDRADVCVCTHVSNVFGNILPVGEIAALCRERGIPFILDASQSAGVLPVDFSSLGATYIAMPGHKGLLGPQGTGVLLCGGVPDWLMSGGTGMDSRSASMPDYLPERLEPGTQNVPGAAGLMAGVNFLRRKGLGKVAAHERSLIRLLARQVDGWAGGRAVFSCNGQEQAGVLSVLHPRLDCEEVAAALGRNGVCVRGGLHCAPQAHITAGDVERGSVRFSVGPWTTAAEIRQTGEIYRKVVTKL